MLHSSLSPPPRGVSRSYRHPLVFATDVEVHHGTHRLGTIVLVARNLQLAEGVRLDPEVTGCRSCPGRRCVERSHPVGKIVSGDLPQLGDETSWQLHGALSDKDT